MIFSQPLIIFRCYHWELSQEAVAVTEGSLIITDVQNKRSKKQLLQIYPPVKLANKKMSIKKEKNSPLLIYNIASLSKPF